MNQNGIKFVAAIAMTFDHVGEFIFKGTNDTLYLIFKSIGRIAYVLFAYMIVEGFNHTSNLKSYFLRLFSFALIIELGLGIISIISGENYTIFGMSQNVIWPLVFGLGGLILLNNKLFIIRLSSILIVALALILNIQYGAYGVLIILIFGLYPNKLTQFLFLVGLNLLFIDVPLLQYLGKSDMARYTGDGWIQWFSLLSFIFIGMYNGLKGKLNTKWFFYIFYPTHLGIIFLISILL
ncbi:MAG: hypothetical protein B6I17_02965 [Tenericutes bacterium 4572_104]|nr:MAG: hypothetical protein B6I17_02965 [Tenericutes bacterium 4572_104]